ncbi:MAG: hypothetical protein NVS9B1_20670 [Candidatus Dormibacteraceae bacterium]
MILIASVVLVAALPFLLWPLLSPPAEKVAEVESGSGREAALHLIEEVELDAATGRLGAVEAERRLEEARRSAEAALAPK